MFCIGPLGSNLSYSDGVTVVVILQERDLPPTAPDNGFSL